MNRIHRSKVGTFHPAPDSKVAWTVNDTRGYTDGGPACDECGACECECPFCGSKNAELVHGSDDDLFCCADQAENNPEHECVGLSFAYVCLDGGEALCPACFEKEAGVEVVECDCE